MHEKPGNLVEIVTESFLWVIHNPFSICDEESWQFKMIGLLLSYVLYDRVSTHENVNEARREIFCQKSESLENSPSAQDALYLDVMKAALQARI